MNKSSVRTRQQIDTVFQSLFDKHSPESSATFAYIQRLLYQFRLSKAYEVKDIIVEVYARGIKAIAQGQEIQTPQAWIKRAALNVIREFRRCTDKIQYQALDDHPNLASLDENMLSHLSTQEDLRVIQLAFNKLSSSDRNILDLRLIHELSWEDISSRLVPADEIANENSARQRGFRALRRLRAAYEELREDYKSDMQDENQSKI